MRATSSKAAQRHGGSNFFHCSSSFLLQNDRKGWSGNRCVTMMRMTMSTHSYYKTKTKTKNQYSMKKKTSLTVSILALVLGLVCLPSGSLAIRGIRTREVLGELRNNGQHRRTTQWKGVAQPSTRGSPKSEDEEDDTEEIPAAERGFTLNGKKQGKKGGKKGKREGDDDSDDEEEDILLNELLECDDPSDPRCIECDDPSDPRCQNKEEVSSEIEQEFVNNLPPAFGENEDGTMDTGIPDNVHGNVGDHFGIGAGFRPNEPSLPDAMRHTIPPFKIVYSLGTVVDESDMDDGDYAELSIQTELYLTRYFTNHYLTEPTEFQEVDVVVQPTSEYWIVRLYVSPAFVVPGNVPSLQSLFDRIIDAFSGQRSKEYILLLNEMGTENPFRNTRSIALLNDIDDETVAAMGARNSMQNTNNTGLTSSENRPRFLTIIIIAGGLLLFAIVGFFWAVQQRRRRLKEEVRQLRLEENLKQEEESRTAGYIASIRRRRTPRYYRDEKQDGLESSQTSTEPVEEYDVEENNAQDVDMADDDSDENQQQTLAELRQAMEVLESLTGGGGGGVVEDKEEPSADSKRMDYYPSPPSDGDGDGDGDINEGEEESSSSSSLPQEEEEESSHSEYLQYLDMPTSFEEEDLRVD